MKKKLMRMPKVVTILVAVLIVAIFLGSMDVAAFFLADTVSLPGYGSSMIAEFMEWLHFCFYACLAILECWEKKERDLSMAFILADS